MEIRYGVVGLIRERQCAGQTVEIQDDSSGSGGYYLHLGPKEDGTGAGDTWVQSFDLAAWIERAGWRIEWPDDST